METGILTGMLYLLVPAPSLEYAEAVGMLVRSQM